MLKEGRTVVCDECHLRRDRDHNAATNMANAVLEYVDRLEWPTPLDFNKAKLIGSNNNDA